jgi:hypothetical protein
MTEAAIEWWRTAGQRSLARSALLEGAEQLKRALAQIATLPATPDLRGEEIKLHVAFANALSLTGDIVDGKEHYDRALAIYDPAEHGPLTTRSGRDVCPLVVSFRVSVVTWLSRGFAHRRRTRPQECARNRPCHHIDACAVRHYCYSLISWANSLSKPSSLHICSNVDQVTHCVSAALQDANSFLYAVNITPKANALDR